MNNLFTSMFACKTADAHDEDLAPEDKKLPDQVIGAFDSQTGIYIFKQDNRDSKSVLDDIFANIVKGVRN